MTNQVSQTINPLHFEDLEPHRFEDLVRQIMYDFKDWKSIEATGRLGSDEGIDILGIESIYFYNDDEDENPSHEERTWIIQCKREKSITPQKIRKILDHDIKNREEKPFGYILVASTYFSKKTRDLFKSKLNSLGVNEFYLYGKSELEDLLFLPKYDHLLFAYFGISLQKRKRTLKSQLSSRLTTKRKLIKNIGDLNEIRHKTILVKPSLSNSYPIIGQDIKNLNWRFYNLAFYMPLDQLSVVTKKHFAYINWETNEWDIIEDYDDGFPFYPELYGLPEKFYQDLRENHWKAREIWDKLSETNKGYYFEVRPIHFDRILLVDEIGDCYNPPPHIIVDYLNNSPFENRIIRYIESGKSLYPHEHLQDPNNDKRIDFFKTNL
jgi:hypothetical protein